MSRIGNELVATVSIGEYKLDIRGCWDGETPENEYAFYDVFDWETGDCLNLGEPYYECPTIGDLKDLIEGME